MGIQHRGEEDKIFWEKNRSWIWVANQFWWRAEPSEQSCELGLGMWCHQSIFKSDDERGVFLFASSVDYQTGSPCLLCGARSIQKQPLLFNATFTHVHIIMLGLNFCITWQPSEGCSCNDNVCHASLFICVSDALLCGSARNDLRFSSDLPLLHRACLKISEQARRVKSIIYSI